MCVCICINVYFKYCIQISWCFDNSSRLKAGVDDRFVKFDMYPDSMTYQIIGAAAEVLGESDDVTQELGVTSVARGGQGGGGNSQ